MKPGPVALAPFAEPLANVREATLRRCGLLGRRVRLIADTLVGPIKLRHGQQGTIGLGPVPSPSIYAAAREGPVEGLEDCPACLGVPWEALALVPYIDDDARTTAIVLPRMADLLDTIAQAAPARNGTLPTATLLAPQEAAEAVPATGPLALVAAWHGERSIGVVHVLLSPQWPVTEAGNLADHLVLSLVARVTAGGVLRLEPARTGLLDDWRSWLAAGLGFGPGFHIGGMLRWPDGAAVMLVFTARLAAALCERSAEPQDCICQTGKADHTDFDETYLGMASLMDIHVMCCRHCARTWINCLRQDEAFTASGRWCRAPLGAEDPAPKSAEDALAWLKTQPKALVGGCYFGGQVFWGEPSGVIE